MIHIMQYKLVILCILKFANNYFKSYKYTVNISQSSQIDK